jgi:DNA helicase-4
MNDDLENKISTPNQFKSAGERKIAEVLDKYGISFKYESPIIITDNDKKQRIWYPDFYLPQFGIYLEFYGFNGNYDYDNSRLIKEQVYRNLV